MKRFCKKIAIIFLLIIIGLILILSILNAIKFRPIIGIVSSSVSSLLGRNFSASGLSFGYNSTYGFSAYLYKVELDNPKWAKQPKMLSLGNATISLSLSSLVTGTLKLTNIVAENVSIDIIDKSGQEKNYLFSNENKSSAPDENIKISPSNSQNNGSKIFIPKILLHNIKITYQNDDRNEYLYIQQLSLKSQHLEHLQLNVDLAINNVPYILIGNVGNINNLFDKNGLDLKLKLTSDINSLNTKVNIGLGDNFQLRLDTTLKIQNIPSFIQTINSGQVPNWAADLKVLNIATNFVYQNNSLANLILQVEGGYKGKDIQLKVNAHSNNSGLLYPLVGKLNLESDTEKIFQLKAEVKEPYSKDEWLNLHLNGNIPNLSYVINKEIPLSNIALNSKVTIVGNQLKVKPFKLTADFKNDPIVANLSLNTDIKPNQPIKTKIIANVDYQKQMILGLNANAVFPAKNGQWLQLNANGGIRQLSALFQIFNINLPYQLTDFEYIIKATGDKPEHINIAIDPVNINVNEQPMLSHASAEIDLKSLAATIKLKTIINHATNSNITLQGLIAVPSNKGEWANLKLETLIYKGSDLNFLALDETKQLNAIGKIDTKIEFQANNGKVNLNILPSSINLNSQELKYNARFVYGLYNADQPLDIKFSATNGKLDKLIISGQGNIKSGQEFSLKAEGNIVNLSDYSTLLPEVTNMTTTVDFSIKDSILRLKKFNLSADSNEKAAKINLLADVDLLKSQITKMNLVVDVADLDVNLNLSGEYQPLNISGSLNLQAKSLTGVNQFIDGWDIGIVPILEDLNLNLTYKFAKNNYYMDMAYLASGTDLKIKADVSLETKKLHYMANIHSKIINIKSIKLAIEKAKNEQDNYVSSKNKLKRHKIFKDNFDNSQDAKEIGKKAAKALNKKVTTPDWMNDNISIFLDSYTVNLNANIDKVVFKKDTAEKVSILVQNNIVPEHSELSITADKLFGAKISSISKLERTEKVYHLKTDTYVGILNLGQLGSAIPALHNMQKGELMLNMYGEAKGMTTNQLVRVFNGKLKIGVNDLQQRLASPSGSIGKFLLLLAGGDWRSGISIKCAIGDFNIVKGDYRINTLMIDTTGAIIQGSGNIDLPAQKINIVLSPEAKYINLTSLSTAFRVVGNFDNIYFFPDAYSTAKTAAAVVGATALAATGIGLIAVGAAVAGQGAYYANKNFCANSLKPLSKQKIQEIKKPNEGIMQNLLDGSSNLIGNTYTGVVDTGSGFVEQGVSSGSNLFKTGYQFFSSELGSDSGAMKTSNEK